MARAVNKSPTWRPRRGSRRRPIFKNSGGLKGRASDVPGDGLLRPLGGLADMGFFFGAEAYGNHGRQPSDLGSYRLVAHASILSAYSVLVMVIAGHTMLDDPLALPDDRQACYGRTMTDKLISSQITADALLADSVVVAEGKLYVQGGGWMALLTPSLPVRHPRIGLGLIMRVPYQHADNMPKRFALKLEDADGNLVPLADAPPPPSGPGGKVTTIEGSFTVGRPAGVEPGSEQLVPLAANIDGLVFEKAGSYVFRFLVDGNEIKALHFRVNHMSQQLMGMRMS
jgi:hypothetical protein